MISSDIVKRAMPMADWEKFFPYLNPMLNEFDLGTAERQAAFLSQIAVESAELRRLSENLNYSASGLLSTWPHRFNSAADANHYSHYPERLANYVYANRMGNGDEKSGDGWAFRGAGALQLTGKTMHYACADELGIPRESVSMWLTSPEGALRSAGWFWQRRGINAAADDRNLDHICDLINIGHITDKVGDAIGYNTRLQYYNRISTLLGVK